MKTEVNLRPFQKEDTEAIEAIIRGRHGITMIFAVIRRHGARIFEQLSGKSDVYRELRRSTVKPAGING